MLFAPATSCARSDEARHERSRDSPRANVRDRCAISTLFPRKSRDDRENGAPPLSSSNASQGEKVGGAPFMRAQAQQALACPSLFTRQSAPLCANFLAFPLSTSATCALSRSVSVSRKRIRTRREADGSVTPRTRLFSAFTARFFFPSYLVSTFVRSFARSGTGFK
jgi:hypothetical protein